MSAIELSSDTLTWLAKQNPTRRAKAYALIGKVEWQRCADDLLYWLDPSKHLLPYVYTRDPKQLYACRLCKDGEAHFFDKRQTHLKLFHDIEAEAESIIRSYFDPMPTTRPFPMKPYVEPIAQHWLREKIMFVEKSRDMVATWLSVTMYTWDTLFHENRENIFQSEDSTKTCDLIQRAYFIYDHQPKFLKNVHRAGFTAGSSRSGILSVPDLNSQILGMPQGPDQIRQYHPSGVFVDEAAFQVQAGDAFMAVKPAIQAGGRYTAISSANPGFFMLACRDALENATI